MSPELVGRSPEWNILRRRFFPLPSKNIWKEDSANAKNYETHSRQLERIRRRLTNTQLKSLEANALKKDFMLKDEAKAREFDRVLNSNPYGSIGAKSGSHLCVSPASPELIYRLHGRLCTRSRVTDSREFFSCGVLDDSTLTSPDPYTGLQSSPQLLFLWTSSQCELLQEESSRGYIQPPSNILDLCVPPKQDSKCFVSCQNGRIYLYKETRLLSSLNLPSEDSQILSWSALRILGDKTLLVASRKSINLFHEDENCAVRASPEAIPDGFIGEILVDPNGKHFFLLNQSSLVLYDVRKLNENVSCYKHGLQAIPGGGGDTFVHGAVTYFGSYTKAGEVLIWASENGNFRGYPRKFSPVDDILNQTIFDHDETYNRVAAPWTGLKFLPPREIRDSLHIISSNAVGDLFCSQIVRGEENAGGDWLLEPLNFRSDEDKWLESYDNHCSKKRFIKKSSARSLHFRPELPSEYPSLKRSFPKVTRKKGETYTCTNTVKSKNTFANIYGKRKKDLSLFVDENFERINKIFNNECIFPDAPSEPESESTYQSESMRSRFSSVSESSAYYLNLPSDSSCMMQQFLKDLEPNMTSTQPEDLLKDDEEFVPLTAGSCAPLSQGTKLSQSFGLSQSLRTTPKTKKKRKIAGF